MGSLVPLPSEPLLADSAPTPLPSRDLSAFRAWLVLVNLVIGMGLLSIPYCFRIGIFMDSIILVFLGCASYVSFILLIDAASTAGLPIDYGKLMNVAFGSVFEWVANLVIFVGFFGVGALHLQFSYTLVASILDEFHSVPHWLYNRWMWIFGLALAIDLPLMFIRSITRYSTVSMGTCILILLYIVHSGYYLGRAISEGRFDPRHKIEYFTVDMRLISSYSIQAFAFHCHPHIGPSMLRLVNPTRSRQYWVMAALVIGTGLCYLGGGLMPYLTLVDEVKDPVVFECYPKGQPLTIVTEAFYGLFLIVTTPLILYAARICFISLFSKKQIETWLWNVVGVGVLLTIAAAAAGVKSIPVMFDFIGGVGVSCILYILPALYYLRICRRESKWKRALSYVLVPLGFATMVVCLYHTIDTLIHGDA
jgi:amino acid permease